MWESGKDECVRTSSGSETSYCGGTKFIRMGGYDFPGQIASSDGSEVNGSMGVDFIVLGGNDGPVRSSDRGDREREFSSNGG